MDQYKDVENKNQIGCPNIINVHNSWISIDPIIGCTNDCQYCFAKLIHRENFYCVHFVDENMKFNFEKSLDIAISRSDIPRVAKYLLKYKNDMLSSYPISIGNNTDMFLPVNEDYLIRFLYWYSKQTIFSNRQIAIVTKQLISESFIKQASLLNLELYIFCSITFLDELEPNVISSTERLNNVMKIRELLEENNIKNIKLVHLLRPFMLTKIQCERLPFDKLKKNFDAFVVTPIQLYSTPYTAEFKKILKLFMDSYNTKENVSWHEYAYNVLSDFLKKSLENDIFYYTESSCAISHLQFKSNYSSAWWYKDRRLFCERCKLQNKSQYDRCFRFSQEEFSHDALINLCDDLKIEVDNKDNSYFFKNKINQNILNLIRISTGKRFVGYDVERTLLWASGESKQEVKIK